MTLEIAPKDAIALLARFPKAGSSLQAQWKAAAARAGQEGHTEAPRPSCARTPRISA